jgi:hypothetical protein
MTKSLRESAKNAYQYLDSIGEQTYYVGGMEAVKRLNTVMGDLRESLNQPKPCKCVSPARCDAYDRCCKYD